MGLEPHRDVGEPREGKNNEYRLKTYHPKSAAWRSSHFASSVTYRLPMNPTCTPLIAVRQRLVSATTLPELDEGRGISR